MLWLRPKIDFYVVAVALVIAGLILLSYPVLGPVVQGLMPDAESVGNLK